MNLYPAGKRQSHTSSPRSSRTISSSAGTTETFCARNTPSAIESRTAASQKIYPPQVPRLSLCPWHHITGIGHTQCVSQNLRSYTVLPNLFSQNQKPRQSRMPAAARLPFVRYIFPLSLEGTVVSKRATGHIFLRSIGAH